MGRQREVNPGDPPFLHRKGDVWYHVSGTLPRKWTALGRNKEAAMQRCEEIERQAMTAERLYWEFVDDELLAILMKHRGVRPDELTDPAGIVNELRLLLRKVKDGLL